MRFITFLSAFLVGSMVFGQGPETSSLPELVVIGDARSEPAIWFATDPKLASVAQSPKVKFHVLDPNGKLYRDRYAAVISGQPPMVLFQRPSGGVIFAASAYTMPRSPNALYDALKHSWDQSTQAISPVSNADCPDGNCPVPTEPAPRLLPWNRDEVQPLPSDSREGWFSSGFNTVMIFGGGVIVLGLLLCFGIVALGLIYLLSKFMK